MDNEIVVGLILLFWPVLAAVLISVGFMTWFIYAGAIAAVRDIWRAIFG